MPAIIRWGVLIGLILIVVSLAVNLAMRPMLAPIVADPTSPQATASAMPLLGFSCGTLLVTLALYFVAGNRAAHETGRALYGVLAGVLAAALSGVASTIVELVYPMPTVQAPEAAGLGALGNQWLMTLVGFVAGLILAAVVSAIGGWWATRNQLSESD